MEGNSRDAFAAWILVCDVVRAHLHCVVEASAGGAIVTTSGNSSVLEPVPRDADLSTVAVIRIKRSSIAASSGVSDGEEGSEGSISGDADTIVEGLSGTVNPAGSAVRLVAHMVNHRLTLGPLNTGVKVCRKISVCLKYGIFALNTYNGPVAINNSTHDALDFLAGGTDKFDVVASNPIGWGFS